MHDGPAVSPRSTEPRPADPPPDGLHLQLELGEFQARVEQSFADARDGALIQRIWDCDHTVWKLDPTEISNRLGWLEIATAMQDELPRLERFAATLRQEGYTAAVLLGMGGSSLAPELMARTFEPQPGALGLTVLDSTDPRAVAATVGELDLRTCLFLVSSKSGGTVETISLFKYCYNEVAAVVGQERAGAHFVAITDPGSSLAELAARYRFRETFHGDPTIGGRYSALSVFGMVPAALLRLDLRALLQRAQLAAENGAPANCPRDGNNVAARLGLTLATLAAAGRDKLTLITGAELQSLADWVEQLIAESTGKEGTGILPVVGEPVAAPDLYGQDRLFVYLRLGSRPTLDEAVAALRRAGHPVVTLHLTDTNDIGAQFWIWQMATAVAGAVLGINPFDQPDVEAAKVQARQLVAAYLSKGELPALEPTLHDDQVAPGAAITVFGTVTAATVPAAVADFVDGAPAGAYLAVQAYVPPTPATDAALGALRRALRDRTRLATTTGYGPRFLHSTGQLHKGDRGAGRFLQISTTSAADLEIPDQAGAPASAISFGVLKAAQALGDRQALRDAGRPVLTLQVDGDVAGALVQLAAGLAG